MSDGGDKDVLVQKGTEIEIDANEIAAIIFNICHTGEGRAVIAANAIIDHLSAKLIKGGAADITKSGSTQ